MNNQESQIEFLTWDATYEIALALKKKYPEQDLEKVSLGQIFEWTIGLSNFEDAPELANDEILAAIFQEWFEEINAL
jgi:FeS assembly protein IscX